MGYIRTEVPRTELTEDQAVEMVKPSYTLWAIKKVRYKLLFLLIGHVSSSATKPQSSQDIFEARWYSFICS